METIRKGKKVHQGHNVRLARNWKGITQEGLGFSLDMEQARISELENRETIDDALLNKIAVSLDVPVDFLKEFDPDKALKNYYYLMKDSTLTSTSAEYSSDIVTQQVCEQNNTVNNTYPIDEIKNLYDKLLEEKDKQMARLEKQIDSLQKQLEELRLKIK